MYKNIFSIISGLVFGIGLTIGGMTNPAKVLAFLNITENWDPSLIFVMGGAIAIVLPCFYLLKNKEKPCFAPFPSRLGWSISSRVDAALPSGRPSARNGRCGRGAAKRS